MSERFIRLYELQNNLYSVGSPVVVYAGALLKDTQTNNIIVQLKFHSVSATPIKALKVGIAAFDIAGKEIEGVDEYQYLDLNIQNGCEFGSNKAIVMPDAVTRSFSVRNIAVVLANGNVQDVSMPMTILPKGTLLQSGLKDAELVKQYKLAVNDEASYIPQETCDLWMCSCGEWNSDKFCTKCRAKKSNALSAYDIPALTDKMTSRLAVEKAQREERQRLAEIERQKAEEQKKIADKEREAKKAVLRKRKIVISSFAIFAIVCLVAGLVIRQGAMRKIAEQYYEKGKCTLSAGSLHTVALEVDGSVVAIGSNSCGQCEVEQWADIISVSAGSKHTVGLKSDGTVVAVGENENGQCNVDGWKNVVAIFSADSHTFAIQNDGTLLMTSYIYNTGEKYYDFESQFDQNGAKEWTQIQYISGDAFHTVGLKEDGTVIANGGNQYGKCDVSSWNNIIQIATGTYHSVGLRTDGIVIATAYIQSGEYNRNYGQTNVENWANIIAIAAGSEHTVGLKSDGTVVAVGNNEHGACDVAEWTDIVAIAAGDNHTVGLKSDGTVVATNYTGEYEFYYGQCETDLWDDIRLPN